MTDPSCADALQLPFAASSVDLVVCTESFHWYPDQASALAELARVLNPGGRLLIASIATVTGAGDQLLRRATGAGGRTSLTFLFTFAIVGGLAFRERAGSRILTGFGALAAAAASAALVARLIQTDPLALAFLGLLVLVAVFGRPAILRHTRTATQ